MSIPSPSKAAAKPHALTVEDIWALDRVGNPALSPDGRHAVVAVTRYSMAQNNSATHLWLLPTSQAAPRRLTACGGKDGQAAWAPAPKGRNAGQGDRIAFIAKRDQEGQKDSTPQLYLMPADGGEAQRVSDFAPGIESFKWLPDGRRIVFAAWVWPELKGTAAQAKRYQAQVDNKESGYATSQAYYRYWDHHVPMGRALHLHLLDVATGKVQDLFEGTPYELPRDAGGNAVYDVRPDGRCIAFLHDPAAVPLMGNRLAVAEIDLRSGAVRAVADDAAWDFGFPRYSPDGQRLALTAANVGVHHTAFNQLALVESDGRWQALGEGWDFHVDGPLAWAADGQSILFTAEERGRRHLWRHHLAEGWYTVEHQGGWVQGFDVAGDVIALAADSAKHPPRVLALGAAGAPRRLEQFNDEALKGITFGELREVAFKGALGDEVQMWLTFPPGFDAKKKHPVMHVIHGGPFAAAGDTFSYRWSPHVFAAAGHVVAQVNYHGSSGFGFPFRHSLIGRQGELELQDLEAATDWLLQQRWTDARRMTATGGSYGGFLVAWMNGHVAPGRYQAYVCHAGVFDRVATMSADSFAERPKDLAARYWENLPAVLAQSPHATAGQMHTPTLVIHGAQDFRVPDCNGLAYYNTLKSRGVDARLLWFADENHWILKPQNSRQWYREFLDWIAVYTAPGRAAKRAGPTVKSRAPK